MKKYLVTFTILFFLDTFSQENNNRLVVDENNFENDLELVNYIIETNKNHNKIGLNLPYFEAKTVEGEFFSSEQINEISFITIWHSRCSPCLLEVSILNELKHIFEDRVSFYGLTFDDVDILKSSIVKYAIDFKNLILDQDELMELNVFGGYPTNLLVVNGVVRYCYNGGPPPKTSKYHLLMMEALKSNYIKVIQENL